MTTQKPGLHPRNRHHDRYDLAALCDACPALSDFITLNPVGEQTINFADPQAVKTLNKALLAHFYAVKEWDIPEGFLCPPVPHVRPGSACEKRRFSADPCRRAGRGRRICAG